MTPEEAIYKTLVNYIKVHGKRIISISSVFFSSTVSSFFLRVVSLSG